VLRARAVCLPSLLISTFASGDVRCSVGRAEIMLLHSGADAQGLNSLTRQVLGNGAQALIGMVQARREAARSKSATEGPPAVGLTMFGVTTTCVQQIVKALEEDHECLVFHATGIGGRSMEKLVDSGLIRQVIDVTTTEICDMLVGGIFPATA